MDSDQTPEVFSGANQSGLRNHNERLLLSLIREKAPIPASDLARQVSLSAQTVSVIVRDLERDGLLVRGKPVRGKVGKPSVPVTLAAKGAYSIGLKIGRRTADLALMDLHGSLLAQKQLSYSYPRVGAIIDFLRTGIDELTLVIPEAHRGRIQGIGLAIPFEVWKWADVIGAPSAEFDEWRDVDIAAEIGQCSELPLHFMNDATAACRAEHHFGAGRQFRDYAYFFVGAFIGGGVVLDGKVLDGNRGNAGALGSLQAVDESGRPVQLIDCASLHLLEKELSRDGQDPKHLWDQSDWSPYAPHIERWIDRAAREIARASLSACAVLEFEAVIIDGAFPETVRSRLVGSIRDSLATLDARGVFRPQVIEGQIGKNARVLGAAFTPISSELFLASALR